MSQTKIVVDSSSNLTELPSVPFACAPLKIITDKKQYADTPELNVHEMVDELYHYSGKSSTSCPNINDWLLAFGDSEEIICITITSALSGSYNSACMAKQTYEEKNPSRRVAVIDSLSTGPEMVLMAEKARDLICAGRSFDEILSELSGYKTELLFVLESMKNLANNGRVSKIAAAAAGILGVRAIGKASEKGTLEMLSKCRGNTKTLAEVTSHMQRLGYKGGKVRISHCLNEAVAEELKAKLLKQFTNAVIEIDTCRGLCSFYAEKGGFIIGFEV
ncbi:MAG: DegV family protein [Clostridia bacterium]|nr:DegV family protein [Clostridia bacterium]